MVAAVATIPSARAVAADLAFRRSLLPDLPDADRIAAAARATRLAPYEPEYRIGLAVRQAEAGRWAEAEALFDSAERLKPDDPRFTSARGALYARWSESDPPRLAQAEASYRRALELAPNTAAYHTALGLVLAQGGAVEQGIASIERAVALDATDYVAYGHLARLYAALGRTAEARRAQADAEYWEAKTGGP